MQKRPLATRSSYRSSRPLSPRHLHQNTFNILVTALLADVLQHKKPLDRSYALHFSRGNITNAEQGRVVAATGDILRRLSFYLYLTELDDPTDQRAPFRLLQAWQAEQNLSGRSNTPPKGGSSQFTVSPHRIKAAQQNTLLQEGCPQWLEKLAGAQLGDLWPEERAMLAQAPLRYVRVNTLKGDRLALQQRLRDEQIQSDLVDSAHIGSSLAVHTPDALVIRSDLPIFRSRCFQEGWFEQQDLGSQQIAPFLAPEPGMLTVDACAGTGGKTLHLAALMKNKGRLIAMDTENHKLDQLRKRANRSGVSNLEVRLIESSSQIKRLRASADRVLLDVPCSGTGVLRRNPEAKWNPMFDDLTQICATQRDILQRYSKMAKVGGEVVYATCSILPMENQEQVNYFLQNCDGSFELLEEMTILPSVLNSDGFYMARLKRIA